MHYKINGIKAQEQQFRRSMLEFVRSTSWTEAKRLQFLDKMFSTELDTLHSIVQERVNYLRKMLPVEEGGCVEQHKFKDYTTGQITIAPALAVVYSGRDCDGVQYSGSVTIVNCTGGAQAAIEKEIEHSYSYADGPMYHTIMRPSEAEGIKYTSRDLTMEAFEDGHSHSISSARYDEEGDY